MNDSAPFTTSGGKVNLICDLLRTKEKNNNCVQWLLSLLQSPSNNSNPIDFKAALGRLEDLPLQIDEMLKNENLSPFAPAREENDIPAFGIASIPPTTLLLFMKRTTAPKTNQNDGSVVAPIPHQADVNGKRFTPEVDLQSTFQEKTPLCSERRYQFLAVPYKVRSDSQSLEGNGCKDKCKVIPMRLRDTLNEVSAEESFASGLESEDFVPIFNRIFGSCASDDLVRKKPAANLMVLLLHIINSKFRMARSQGFVDLLTSIAKGVWGEKVAEERLKDLQIPQGHIVQFTLVVFGAIVPVKLGYLMGESVALAINESVFGRKQIHLLGNSHLDLLQLPDGQFPHIRMKEMSNTVIRHKISLLNAASLADFILENAVTAMKSPSTQEMELKDKDIWEENSCKKQRWALDLLLEARKHHLDIRQILSEYEKNQKDRGFRLDNDDGKKFFLDKAKKKIYNPRSNSQAPKVLFFVISLLTQFCCAETARALVELLSSSKGTSLLPSGPHHKAYFGQFVDKWNLIYGCLQEAATALWGHSQKLVASGDRADFKHNKKIVVSTLASKLSMDIFPVVAKYGLRVELPTSWEKKYDHLFIRLKLKSEDDSNLDDLVSVLYKAVQNGSEDSPVKFDNQSDNFTTLFRFKMGNPDGDDDVSLLDLVTSLLEDKNQGLANMMHGWLKSEIQRKKAEVQQKAKKSNPTMSTQESAVVSPTSNNSSLSPFIDTDEEDNGQEGTTLAGLANTEMSATRNGVVTSEHERRHWKNKFVLEEAQCQGDNDEDDEDDEDEEDDGNGDTSSFGAILKSYPKLASGIITTEAGKHFQDVTINGGTKDVVEYLLSRMAKLSRRCIRITEGQDDEKKSLADQAHKYKRISYHYKQLMLKCEHCSQNLSTNSSGGSTNTLSPANKQPISPDENNRASTGKKRKVSGGNNNKGTKTSGKKRR